MTSNNQRFRYPLIPFERWGATSKDPRFREPLSLKEREKGAAYYTADEIDRIIKTFEPREGFDRADFARELEDLAEWHLTMVKLSACRPGPPWPSQTERNLRALAGRLSMVRKRLFTDDFALQCGLYVAARVVAKRDGSLPDFGPFRVWPSECVGDSPHDWTAITSDPCDQQRQIAFRNVEWLARVAQEAVEISRRTKGKTTGHAVPDLFRAFARLRVESSAERPSAYKETKDGEATGKIKGNMINFLEACFRPLGYTGERAAILATYERVKPATSRRRQKNGKHRRRAT